MGPIMKQFFKDNSYTVVRFLIFQIGADILGFITSFATVRMEAKWVFPASSIFCVFFYLFIIATICYENGQKDGIRIEAGKIKKQPWKYFVIALIANSINLLLAAIALVGRLIISAPLSGQLEGVYSPAWLASLQESCAVIARFLQCMYLGIIQSISEGSVIMLLIIPFPAIITAGIAYLVGIRYKDGFKKPNDKDSGTKRYS